MESLPGDNDWRNSTSSSETNWMIAAGSVDGSVTYESSIFPIDSEAVDAGDRTALVLKPPSPNCDPCEIKISFAQKHEIRQVYVRSTARVYEIYFAPSILSSNEYLCTVRCGIAARDDDILHATYVEELAGAHTKCYTGEHAKEKCSDDGSFVSGEDEWIDVKVPDSSLQDNLNKSVPEKIDANQGRSSQDFYEATAEITDADACSSLTLRLLSLQNKGCLIIDEIYIFADPVESADSETQATQVGNSSGSSLMALLVPTLLQLSKTGSKQIQDKHASDTRGKGEYLGIGLRTSDSSNIASEVQQEESIAAEQDLKLLEMNVAMPEPPQFPVCAQVSDARGKGEYVEVGSEVSDSMNIASEIQKEESIAGQEDLKLQQMKEATHGPPKSVCPQVSEKVQVQSNSPRDPIERVLEQLVSRVSKIEDICLRFEENMLRPISSIEARLQQVEQQVELLTRNSQYSGLPCSRISAPAFSCTGSNSSSFCNEGCDSPACGAFELKEKDVPSGKISNPPDNVSTSVNYAKLLPSLVVTAPEFSCGEEEENGDAFVPEEQEKTKLALSIDNALAAALAGLLCTTVVQPSQCNQTLTVTSPELAIDKTNNEGNAVLPSAASDKPVVLPAFSSESGIIRSVHDSNPTPCNSLIPATGQVVENVIAGQDQLAEGGTSCGSLGTTVDCLITQVALASTQTEDCQITELNCGGGSSERIILSDCERTNTLKHSVQDPTDDTSYPLPEGDTSTAKDDVEESDQDIVQNVLKSSSLPCVVDFELPILDVKFGSQTSSAKSPLEALLANVPEFVREASCLPQRDEGVIDRQSSVILVEDGYLKDHHLLVEMDGHDAEGEDKKEPYTSNEPEIFASLI
ncbi:hypothetical protein NMG60_11023391 [Bertholletia excelsa]